MKYIVHLGYKNTFTFDSASSATAFAEVALTHKSEHDEHDFVEIRVKKDGDDNDKG